MNVVMEPNTEALSEAVVTASIRGSTVAEETVPVSVLKPYLAQSANTLDLKGLVAKTPGVSILDGQVSIRGGSGYSYGVGSRVQMLLDGLPLLSGDLGEIWWSYLPMEHVDQVEVVKSSASAMYGSGASNGVIHMRTAWPGDTSETRVSVFNGVYQAPDSANWRWWRDSYTPVSNGMDVSHRQSFGEVDVVAGGSVFSDKTYLSVGHEQRLARAPQGAVEAVVHVANRRRSPGPIPANGAVHLVGRLRHKRVPPHGRHVERGPVDQLACRRVGVVHPRRGRQPPPANQGVPNLAVRVRPRALHDQHVVDAAVPPRAGGG